MRNKVSTLLTIVLLGAAANTLAATGYQQSNLVSDGFVPAAHTDPNLVNSWGLVFNPTGFSWVADNGSGLSTLYDGNGVAQSLVVSVPGDDGPADPTGIVFNGSNSFVVNDGQGHSGAGAFIFASEDGTISGWSPTVPLPAPSTEAHVAVDDAASGAVFKGLAIGTSGGSQFIFATDFHNNHIDVFNSTFAPVVPAGCIHRPKHACRFCSFWHSEHRQPAFCHLRQTGRLPMTTFPVPAMASSMFMTRAAICSSV